MTDRREQILTTAARLFAERGFHGVSIAELGRACHVSGPALYKHFEAKEAILAEMLVGISERLLGEGRRRVTDSEDPLAALVEWHVSFALDHPELIVVQDRDWASLPDDARERVRRLQRSYVDLWARELRRTRPDLDAREAKAVVHATFGLLNSTPHSTLVGKERMRAVLQRMGAAALNAQDVIRRGRPGDQHV